MNILAQSNTPVIQPPYFDSVPSILQCIPRWLMWNIGKTKADGKYGKIPVNRSGKAVNAHDSRNWLTFDQAKELYGTEQFSGVAIDLPTEIQPVAKASDGSDLFLVGIDIDRCVVASTDGVRGLTKDANEILFKLGRPYVEYSPSLTGLRIFCLSREPFKGVNKNNRELYCHGRFLTITGAGVGEVKEVGQSLADLHAEWSGGHQAGISKPLTTSGTAQPTGVAAVLIGLGNPQKHPWALAEAESILASIDPDIPEGEWWATLNQLAEWSDGCNEARGLSKRWSRGDLHGRLAEKWDEAAFDKKWKRAVESVGREGNAGWTSLKATAEACGYVAPEKSQSLTATGDISFANAEPGDIVAARIYAQSTRDKLIYVSKAGRWLRWDGTRWSWCDKGEEMAHAKSTADMILQSAVDLVKGDKDKHQKRLSSALRLQNLPRLEAMIELAKSESGMCVGQMTELDSDPWLLGVRNGVVNLHDGGLLAPDPKMLMTRQAAAEYRHDAECPRWLAFLDSIFEGDTETVAFIQRALGYTLTGVTTEEALFICFGFGANGKSVFGNVVSAILGDYAQAAPPSLLTVRRDGDAGPRNDIARLCGARLVSINETQNGDRLDEQIVKMLAGREPLSARFLHKEYFDFLPTAKPWLRTNHRPIVTGDDDGVWRRLHLVPFRRKFAEEDRDPWLEQKILEERDGILAWMVQGCLEWQRNGLNPSQLVRRESATYRKESDLLGEFLEEKTAVDQTSREEQTKMFLAWCVWNEINGTRHGSKTSFTRKLSERGVGVGKSNSSRFYTGLRLL